LVYGVRKNAGEFSAHAWVDAGGMNVNGPVDDSFHEFELKSSK